MEGIGDFYIFYLDFNILSLLQKQCQKSEGFFYVAKITKIYKMYLNVMYIIVLKMHSCANEFNVKAGKGGDTLTDHLNVCQSHFVLVGLISNAK